MRRTFAVLGLGSSLVVVAACGSGLEPRQAEGAAPPTTEAVVPASEDEAEPGDGGIDAAGVPATDDAAGVDDAPRQAVLEAVDDTLAVGTGQYEMLVLFDAATTPPDFPIQQVRAVGEFSEDGMRHRLEVAPAQEPVEETVVDGTIYTVAGGGRCSSVALSDPMAERSPAEREISPIAVLEELSGIRAEVTELGRLRIHDDRTTHFATTLTLEEAIVAVPDDDDERYLGLPDSFLAAEHQVDLFVDDDGLVRRAQLATPAIEANGVDLPASTTIVDFSALGSSVTVEAPAVDCPEVSTGFQTVPTG